MLFFSLIAVVVGFVSLCYGNYINLDGNCFDRDMTNVFGNLLKYGAATPGETFVIVGIVALIIGIVVLFVQILNNKSQSLKTNLLLSLDLVIPSIIMLFGVLFSWVGQNSFQGVADDLNNIGNILYDDEYVIKIAVKAVLGQQFIMWGLILAFIGGIILVFNILKVLFSVEKALSIYIVAASGLSSFFLLTKPMYGLVVPETVDKVDFYVQPFSFMADNGTYDISPAYINLWCSLLFIIIFVSLAFTIISQFMPMTKMSIISSISSLASLLLMFLGLMAIYSLLNNNLSVGHSLTVNIEYAYCLLLSLFAMIANFIKTNTFEI